MHASIKRWRWRLFVERARGAGADAGNFFVARFTLGKNAR